MRRLMMLLTACMWLTLASAQEGRKFSPERFRADLQQYVTQEAGLTEQEVAKFFPIYDEMVKRQRPIHKKIKQLTRNKPADEEGCVQAIKERDNLEMEIRQIQKQFHRNMLAVLPAGKVYDAILAIDKFHRKQLKHWMRPKQRPEDKR